MNDISDAVWPSMSDKALTKAIGKFVQHHRLNQNKTQSEVSKDANISRSTLSLIERGENVSLGSLIQVLRVLDLLHIMSVFKVEEEISPIEYAKLRKQQKSRARSKKVKEENDNTDLGW